MRRRLHAGMLALLFCSAAAATADPQVYLERQVLIPFRLWDAAAQEYMTDLSRIRLDEIRIQENGEDQVPLSVDLEHRPLSLVLAVDISGSMEEEGSLQSVRQAARRLGDRLNPPDRIAVLSFNREVVLHSRPSDDRQLFRRNLAALHSWGFTAVYDAIHEGLETLEHEPDPRAIILFTDGADNRSTRTMKQVADQAREARIPLFFICHEVSPSDFSDLVDAANETGGRVFRSARDQDLLRIFGTIADGLRNTFVVAYRPSSFREDPIWRDLNVKYAARRLKLDTSKTGYDTGTTGELPHLAPVGSDGKITEPYPADLCPRNQDCDLPLVVTAVPGPPSQLTIEGWIDVGHDMGAMVHPTRYWESVPVPDDPRAIDLKYWPFHRQPARPGQVSIHLPAPETLPRSIGRFWESILSTGATFHVTGMEQTQPAEYRPTLRTMTIPAIPGMARTGSAGSPLELWWTDGRITADFRKTLSRWIFTLVPSYRRWTEERYREETENVVEAEVHAALARVPGGLEQKMRDDIADLVETETREARSRTWNSITSGAGEPTAHLLPRYADTAAADWLNRVDAVLVDRLLAMPVPEGNSLDTNWLAPAIATWSRLRTFFSPAGHQTLVPGIPFLDETTGTVHLQRVILPWIEQRSGERFFGRFPAATPAGLLTIADLIRDSSAGPLLGNGNYRCREAGISVTPAFNRQAEQRPAEWLLRRDALLAEKGRLKDIRRQLPPGDSAWILEELQGLDRQLRTLRRPAGTRVEVMLQRAEAPGVGLRLVQEGDDAATATPLPEPGFTLDAADPELLADLPGLAERNGLERTDPAVVNAVLAAAINGLDGPLLAGLLSDGPAFDSIRLRWSGPRRGSTGPARLIREDSGTVLEIDLAGTTAGLLKDALASLRRLNGS